MDKPVSSLPAWFQRWGVGAWLVVGMVLVVVGAIWLLETTSSIVDPLIAGFVIGAVAGVLVDRLEHRGWPRAAGAGLVAFGLIAIAVLVVGLALAGISSQATQINTLLSDALDKLRSSAQDIGITSASDAAQEIRKAVPEAGHTLLKGVAGGISGLASLLVFLGFTAFATFFLIKDGPTIGRWIERHLGMDPPRARIVMTDAITALRRYFLGLTLVGAFNATLVVIGALIIGLPLFGMVGLVLAAPLVSAAVHIHDDLAARAVQDAVPGDAASALGQT